LAERQDLIKIAVTGSYGKTSVKNFLFKMLSAKYSVLMTPESYNTPMGISKTVQGLDSTHEVFLAEMGARRVGDIKKLMKLISPDLSILTGINNQHLETFKKQENITREKCYAVNMLREGGTAVVPARLQGTPQLESVSGIRLLYVGGAEGGEVGQDADAVGALYGNISVCKDGTVFTLTLGGESFECYTPLLGDHNIENIALAAALAYELNVPPSDIVHAVKHLEAVPHRLQLIQGNGVRIIDDSFNGNPDGARSALKVLGMFCGRKIVVTPGLVELGEQEKTENRLLGAEIAEVADAVILIGKDRVEPLRGGLKDKGFAGQVYTYPSLKEAEENFKNVLKLGDTLLILNDLPDHYDE
jgi:UDP-N-acetylmuramoyl-tripeptide--D-alanyl-D-alanine ligase